MSKTPTPTLPEGRGGFTSTLNFKNRAKFTGLAVRRGNHRHRNRDHRDERVLHHQERAHLREERTERWLRASD